MKTKGLKGFLRAIEDLHAIRADVSKVAKLGNQLKKIDAVSLIVGKIEAVYDNRANIIKVASGLNVIKSIDLKFDNILLKELRKLNTSDIADFNNKYMLIKDKLPAIELIREKINMINQKFIDDVSYVSKMMRKIKISDIKKIDILEDRVSKLENKEIYRELQQLKKEVETLRNENYMLSSKLQKFKIVPVIRYVSNTKLVKGSYEKHTGNLYLYLYKPKEKEYMEYNAIGKKSDLRKFDMRSKGFVFFAEDKNTYYIKNSNDKGDWTEWQIAT